jgi:large subunit ribosomal protein L5
MELTKAKLKNTPEALTQFGYKNKMAAPTLVKVVVSSGTGSGMKKDREKNNTVSDRLAKITGQKTSLRVAKQSVASFKIREGDPVGVTVTLRGARMLHFMDKLIHIALPRTKDFRGLDKKAVDSMGNMTLGIKEHTIFPEAADEDLRDVFGLAITVVSTAKGKEEAIAFFEHLGIPFKK